MLNFLSFRNNKEFHKLMSVVVDQTFMSVTTLLTTVVLARIYPKDTYANIVLLFSLTLFILGFQSAIISKPYAIGLNDLEDTIKKNYFDFNLTLKVIFTLLTALVFPILYMLSYEEWSIHFFLIFLLYVIAYSSYFFVRETLLGERRTRLNMSYGILCSVSICVLLGIIFFSNNIDIKFYLVGVSAVYISLSIAFLIRNKTSLNIRYTNRQEYWLKNWSIGKFLLGSNFLFHVSSSIYPWLLLYLSSKDDIAIYGVLMSIAALVNPLLTALSSYLLPVFVQLNQDHKAVNRQVIKWFSLFSILGLALIFIGVFLGQDLIVLLFGIKYKNLGYLVVLPFVVQSLNVAFQPFKIALNAIKRTDIAFWILIPRSILTLAFGYFLVSAYSLHGVFYTMFIEQVFYHTSYWVVYKKIMRKNFINE